MTVIFAIENAAVLIGSSVRAQWTRLVTLPGLGVEC